MAGLSGKIFTLSGHVGGARTPHPHLVAVEFSDRCWLLPAYTVGGHEIEQYKANVFPGLGLRPDQAFVELDNAVHVKFYDGRPPHSAVWVVERIDRWPIEELNHRRPVGEMDAAGLLQVLTGLLALMDAKPDRYSAPMRRRVGRTADELRTQLGGPDHAVPV
jgi:hypothetical protein